MIILIIIKKENLQNSGVCCPGWLHNKTDFARELKKKQLWNMKLMIIPIVIGAFGTVTKG